MLFFLSLLPNSGDYLSVVSSHYALQAVNRKWQNIMKLYRSFTHLWAIHSPDFKAKYSHFQLIRDTLCRNEEISSQEGIKLTGTTSITHFIQKLPMLSWKCALWKYLTQECIQVGLPPARRPYLPGPGGDVYLCSGGVLGSVHGAGVPGQVLPPPVKLYT